MRPGDLFIHAFGGNCYMWPATKQARTCRGNILFGPRKFML